MSGGDLDTVRGLAVKNLEALERFDADYVMTACATCGGALHKFYPTLIGKRHPELHERLKRIADRTVDASDLLLKLGLDPRQTGEGREIRVTYHDPCHLAHCQGVRSEPRRLIRLIPGIDFRELADADACCGSAGTYGIRHPAMADPITSRKIDTIRESGAEVVVTGNPGCLLQIRDGLSPLSPPIRVMHLTELLWMSIQGSG
jgi:glycolate oxidase iron-sulfur subunit